MKNTEIKYDAKELEKRREKLIKELEDVNSKLKIVGEGYEKFFLKKSCGEDKIKFKLYKRFPSMVRFQAYIKYSGATDRYGYDDPHHPLDIQSCWDESKSKSLFRPEELAVFIKLLYQFQTGKEYSILTLGNMIEPAGWCNAYPKLYYLVGENEKLLEYLEYNGKFYEDVDKFKFTSAQEGLIAIPHDSDRSDDSLEKYSRIMKCYDYKTIRDICKYYFRKNMNVFKDHLNSHLNEINSHKDMFKFLIAEEDNFISDILYSIMIYKHRNGIYELTDQDYADIIYELYRERISSVSEQTQIEIPKRLKYIKNDEIRKKFESSVLK